MNKKPEELCKKVCEKILKNPAAVKWTTDDWTKEFKNSLKDKLNAFKPKPLGDK